MHFRTVRKGGRFLFASRVIVRWCMSNFVGRGGGARTDGVTYIFYFLFFSSPPVLHVFIPGGGE